MCYIIIPDTYSACCSAIVLLCSWMTFLSRLNVCPWTVVSVTNNLDANEHWWVVVIQEFSKTTLANLRQIPTWKRSICYCVLLKKQTARSQSVPGSVCWRGIISGQGLLSWRREFNFSLECFIWDSPAWACVFVCFCRGLGAQSATILKTTQNMNTFETVEPPQRRLRVEFNFWLDLPFTLYICLLGVVYMGSLLVTSNQLNKMVM